MSDSKTQADDDNINAIPTSTKTENGSNSKLGMMIVYKECLKNHAASLGAYSTDGCGEFIAASNDTDTILCSACGCHRNFHRKEVDIGGASNNNASKNHAQDNGTVLTMRNIPHISPSPNVGPSAIPSKGDEKQIKVERMVMSKKRYRTRFTNEQKEKMLEFAHKTNWKIQRVDEGLVQQFCQEIGIKKRVLKIWMHNNKHFFVKEITNTTLNDQDASKTSSKLNEEC